MKKYLGEKRRAGTTRLEQPLLGRHEASFARSQFVAVTRREYRVEQLWDCESIVGLLYSSSFAARPLFGAHAAAFERDLRAALLKLNPGDEFRETAIYDAMLGWKR